MRALLVDDHAIVTEGIQRLLADAHPDAVWGEARTAAAALDALRTASWDLVILDLSLPGASGLEVLATVHRDWPLLPVLVFTMFAEEQQALRCIRAGAWGYVCKTAPASELVLAVERLLAGKRYVTLGLAELLAVRVFSDTGRPLHEALSARELQVMRLLSTGLSVKEIGSTLDLSDKTVSTYRTRLLEKMHMRSAAQLMRYAIRMDLVE